MILSALSRPDTLLPIIVAYSAIVLLAFPLHEFAHAWMAVRLGDRTPYYQGRLTLNPRAHLDPVGALMLAVGGLGWAKPVMFVPTNLRNAPSYKAGIVLVALAGPAMNLLIAAVAALAYRLGVNAGLPGDIAFVVVVINLSLFFLNLIPLVPLDGSKVLWGLMPYTWSRTYEQIQQYSLFILLILIFPIGGTSLLGLIIGPPVELMRRVLLGF
ncbi:MAG TPA: site-2 protease family protein [Anaerolineae bacterium]